MGGGGSGGVKTLAAKHDASGTHAAMESQVALERREALFGLRRELKQAVRPHAGEPGVGGV